MNIQWGKIENSEEMLSGHSIIYFGPEKWEGMWRNRHQLMSRFALNNKVMYVEPVISLSQIRKGMYSWKSFWHAFRKKRVTLTNENVYIYHSLLYAPVSGHFFLAKITWRFWVLLFQISLMKLGFTRPIIWLSRPGMSTFPGSFNEKLVIYHVVDEYLAYPGVSIEVRETLERSEKHLLKKSDLVIVVSEKLLKRKKLHNKNTILVPNAVDYESYNAALSSDKSQPSDIVNLPRPLIGYSGLISRRLDLGLIEYIAATHHEYSLVFIGKVNDKGCEAQMARLRQMGNVHFLGLKDVVQVPYYVKEFDVGIVPYVINEETENLSALKLYDFLAVGLPIVTTNFPAVKEFNDIVYVANSQENFQLYIENALSEDTERLNKERRHKALENTWDHRVCQLSNIIQTCLKKKTEN